MKMVENDKPGRQFAQRSMALTPYYYYHTQSDFLYQFLWLLWLIVHLGPREAPSSAEFLSQEEHKNRHKPMTQSSRWGGGVNHHEIILIIIILWESPMPPKRLQKLRKRKIEQNIYKQRFFQRPLGEAVKKSYFLIGRRGRGV